MVAGFRARREALFPSGKLFHTLHAEDLKTIHLVQGLWLVLHTCVVVGPQGVEVSVLGGPPCPQAVSWVIQAAHLWAASVSHLYFALCKLH